MKCRDRIDAIRRELLVMCSQVSGRISKFSTQVIALDHRTQNRERSPQQSFGYREIALFDCFSNSGTAHSLPIDGKRGDILQVKVVRFSQRSNQRYLAAAICAKTPAFAHTNRPQLIGVLDQPLNKIVRFSPSKRQRKLLNEKRVDAKPLDELLLMLGRRQQSGSVVRTKNSHRMRVERQDD